MNQKTALEKNLNAIVAGGGHTRFGVPQNSSSLFKDPSHLIVLLIFFWIRPSWTQDLLFITVLLWSVWLENISEPSRHNLLVFSDDKSRKNLGSGWMDPKKMSIFCLIIFPFLLCNVCSLIIFHTTATTTVVLGTSGSSGEIETMSDSIWHCILVDIISK